MSYDTSNQTSRRTITAFFDSRQDANEPIERLGRAGIARANINIVEGANRSQGASVSRDDEGPGFWEALKDLFLRRTRTALPMRKVFVAEVISSPFKPTARNMKP